MAELEKAELTSIRLEAGKIPDKEEEVEQKLVALGLSLKTTDE